MVFFQLSGPYQKFTQHADAYPEFTGHVEEVLQKGVAQFLTRVSKEKESSRKTPQA